MYIDLRVKYALFLSDFNETWIVSMEFSKILIIPDFTKIRPVGAELFHSDRTDITKLIVPFRSFVSAPKKLNQNFSQN